MAIIMSSFLVPISPALPYLVEDIMVRGGFRCLNTLEERGKLHPMAKKPGMLVWCADPGQLYQLDADKVTWKDADFGGKTDGEPVEPFDVEFESPIITSTREDGKTLVGMANHNKIPKASSPGMTLISGPNDTLMWVDSAGTAQPGQRVIVTYEVPQFLAPSQATQFPLELSKTALLLSVKLNAFDIKLEGFSTPEYSDRNPYTFVSSTNLLEDEGIREEDGHLTKKRRYAVLSNPVGGKIHYFRIQNVGVNPAMPTLTIEYLVME